jgi:hypothetical protein
LPTTLKDRITGRFVRCAKATSQLRINGAMQFDIAALSRLAGAVRSIFSGSAESLTASFDFFPGVLPWHTLLFHS